jgi:translocator protein
MEKIIKLLGCIAVSGLAGAIGSFATFSNVKTWYVTLAKPSFTPPSWLFGPVWTLLYIMMGVSLYLVWETPAQGKGAAYTFFFVQLALNALWSLVFFGAHSLTGGLVNILLLWVMILLTMSSFMKINQTAAWLLLPYILWVTFATLLNASLVKLN